MRVLRVRYQERVFYAALQQITSEEGGQESGADLFVQCLNKELGFTEPIPLNRCTVVSPVMPTKMVCVAVNYRQHAEEMGHAIPDEPVLFLKPPSAVIGSGHPIVLPRASQQVDFEGELAMVMGKNCRNVAVQDVPAHIFGYACANDVTARDLQKKDGQYGRAKGFDTFAPIGPWIETEVAAPHELTLITRVNDEIRQESSTSDMIFQPHEIVSRISRVMTLFPGDVILTGTPSGVGPLAAGDEVRVEIDEVGILINTVVDDPEQDEQPKEGAKGSPDGAPLQ